MLKYYLLIILMTLTGAFGALFLKKTSAAQGIFEVVKNTHVYAGAFFYVTSAVINIYVLKYVDYTIVLPLTSFTYVWTMILANRIMKEKITKKKIYGTVFILIGSLLVSIG